MDVQACSGAMEFARQLRSKWSLERGQAWKNLTEYWYAFSPADKPLIGEFAQQGRFPMDWHRVG